ncbi:hypothetical protein Ahy_A06g029603 [Arachis hypogaea]|uniref:Uncharacterized protein n=1 Tax=Arachis hypogaea TaxID=3818 RepID=A0A445CTN9_ARAHY|nr:hypothetical protein Ahy_A06g029603 [Arachis hypogaea]
MYDHPWSSYKKIHAETRERWFQKWANKFIWEKTHNVIIRKIFDHRMASQLQQIMQDVCERYDHLTICLRLDIKKALYRRLTNRANKASSKSSKYTGWSTIFMKTKTELSKSLNYDATIAETFKYTHTLKENKNIYSSAAQQLQQSEERYNEILAHVSNIDSLRLELRQELKRIQQM